MLIHWIHLIGIEMKFEMIETDSNCEEDNYEYGEMLKCLIQLIELIESYLW